MSVYFVVDVDKVLDASEYTGFLELVRPVIKEFGGQYLCKGGISRDLSGEWKQSSIAIIEFPSRAALDKCFGSEEFRKLMPMRDRSSKSHLIFADGIDACSDNREGLAGWQWNERMHCGTDYGDLEEVERYDFRMGEFRDVEAENSEILELLSLEKGAKFLEIGCGTGRLALAAAEQGLVVTACDVSGMMLSYVKKRAEEKDLKLKLLSKGFLELREKTGVFDAVVSGIALHHIPDVWKTVAVENVWRMLRSGGQFVLRDVVFDWEAGKHAEFFKEFVGSFPLETRLPAERHAAKEFSTHNWIMEGILERAGFEILSNSDKGHAIHLYHCRKI